MVKEQEVSDVTMDQMMELDVPQDVQDGRLRRVVPVERQQLLIHVFHAEPHVHFLHGLHLQSHPHQLLNQLNKKNKNVNQSVETERSHAMKIAKTATPLKTTDVQTHVNSHMDMLVVRHDRSLLISTLDFNQLGSYSGSQALQPYSSLSTSIKFLKHQ